MSYLLWSVQLICPVCKTAPEFIIRLPKELANTHTLGIAHHAFDSHDIVIKPIAQRG